MVERVQQQRFGPTSGQATGWLGLVALGSFAVYLLVREQDVETVVVLAAVCVLVWCFLLRPRVLLRPDVLVLRNAFSDFVVPLRRVEDVVVRQVTLVTVGDEVYQGIGVGRPLRKLVREHPGRRPVADDAGRGRAEVPDLMVQRVLAQVAAAQPGEGDEQVLRRYAVPELGAIAVLLGVFLVLAVL